MYEYLYYRLFHYYEKLYKKYYWHKGKEGLGQEWINQVSLSTNLALSLWVVMLVFCIAMSLRIFLPLEALFRNYLFVFLLIFGTGVVFFIYNKKHFKDKVPELDDRFKDVRANKWMKTWLFLILFFLSMLFFMIFPFAFSHLMKLVLV